MLRAIKVRIYPTEEQKQFLRGQFGAVRYCYNKAVAIKKHHYKVHGESLSVIKDIKPLLAKAKKLHNHCWLMLYDSMAEQEAVRNADKAFTRFFNKQAGFPRFKSKRGKQSSYHCTGLSIGEDWIRIPKMESINAKIHRPVEGTLRSITLSLTTTGKYFASILYDDGQPEILPLKSANEEEIIGVDVGLKTFATLSDGKKIDNPHHLKKAEENLKRKQKQFSRTKKGSHRREKARMKLAKAHERVANQREDFLHKASCRISSENQVVVTEDLNVSGMQKNHRLAKSIGDAGWGTFIRMLEYKLKRQGKRLVKIERFYPSSKKCSNCGSKLKELGLHVRIWTCPVCGQVHDRDLNAAVNIRRQGIVKLKAEGLSVSARGGCVSHNDSCAVAVEPRSPSIH